MNVNEIRGDSKKRGVTCGVTYAYIYGALGFIGRVVLRVIESSYWSCAYWVGPISYLRRARSDLLVRGSEAGGDGRQQRVEAHGGLVAQVGEDGAEGLERLDIDLAVAVSQTYLRVWI